MNSAYMAVCTSILCGCAGETQTCWISCGPKSEQIRWTEQHAADAGICCAECDQ